MAEIKGNRPMAPFWEQLAEHLQKEGIDLERKVINKIRRKLEDHGVNLDIQIQKVSSEDGEQVREVKVVAVAPKIHESVEELGRAPRDNVVMVRVDEETLRTLDAWVETGAVKSRSEAAALFIREGLKVRGAELEQLRDALREVEQARDRLQRKAQEVFGKAKEA